MSSLRYYIPISSEPGSSLPWSGYSVRCLDSPARPMYAFPHWLHFHFFGFSEPIPEMTPCRKITNSWVWLEYEEKPICFFFFFAQEGYGLLKKNVCLQFTNSEFFDWVNRFFSPCIRKHSFTWQNCVHVKFAFFCLFCFSFKNDCPKHLRKIVKEQFSWFYKININSFLLAQSDFKEND